MYKFTIEQVSAVGVLLLGIVSFLLAILTFISNHKHAKREKIFDLYNVWDGNKKIDKDNLIPAELVNAVNALFITATLWNNNIVDKIIIYQSYWIPFENLYDTLSKITEKVPGQDEQWCDKLTPDIRKAYKDMRDPKWKNKAINKLKTRWWRLN